MLEQHRFDTIYGSTPHYYNVLKHMHNGSIKPEAFDALVLDLVSFLEKSYVCLGSVYEDGFHFEDPSYSFNLECIKVCYGHCCKFRDF